VIFGEFAILYKRPVCDYECGALPIEATLARRIPQTDHSIACAAAQQRRRITKPNPQTK
jgi:hypothetical protein